MLILDKLTEYTFEMDQSNNNTIEVTLDDASIFSIKKNKQTTHLGRRNNHKNSVWPYKWKMVGTQTYSTNSDIAWFRR